ncbi:metallophosphoesterase [Peteryoungia desertarenae]|uniref:Metallophosphoesterase n=1 Tax=Peteryoungia desertarenae TaxID=1813451 RepID=A0ABX6QLY2_9HYPH|nr:metallophosphoesterase [Peteryoungia desertarenae]QLF69576.1 metallophosphoesterase [Peteryoungia desertarenae]
MTVTTPLLRLGIIADPQYAELPPNEELNRFYANSLKKIRDAVDLFNANELDAVVVLGDLIDADAVHFEPVLRELGRLRHPQILLPGNHDFLVEPEHLAGVYHRLSMPAPYYSRQVNGIHLIILDGSEISLFAPPPGDPRRQQAESRLTALRASKAPNAHPWNAGIGGEQRSWLKALLDDMDGKGEKAIVLGHYPVYPPSDHNLWNAEDVAGLLARSPSAVAYLCGHDHRGGFGTKGGTHFVTFKGMVDTEADNAFAIVELFADRLNVMGFGREVSRELSLCEAR